MALMKPTLVFIPGAWHTPEYFSDVIEPLKMSGYECHPLRLPSVGGDDTKTAADDATHIRSTTLPLVEAGKQVVLIMHSYGGIPGTESVKGGLAKIDREAVGKQGGVIGLVYLTSFLIDEQQSLNTTLKSMPDWIKPESNKLFLVKTSEIMYSDLPLEIGQELTKKICYHAAPAFATPLTYAAYRRVPTTYLICKKDKVIPLELQQTMANLAGEEAITYHCDSGHFPMLSVPEVVVELIRKAAGENIHVDSQSSNET